MGEEINKLLFTEEDNTSFMTKVQEETKILMSHFEQSNFAQNDVIGYEVEGWLLDQSYMPNPMSDYLVSNVNHHQIVPEISRYNFEINGTPFQMNPNILKDIHEDMDYLWTLCHKETLNLNSKALMIGSVPTLQESMLRTEYLYPNKRYEALCQQVMHLRNNKPLKLHISGNDLLIKNDVGVITECSATSLQLHFGSSLANSKNIYNASLLASPFTVAVAANSPFLFGNELWDETRIPVFQQAVDIDGHQHSDKACSKRVTFGSGYLKNSVLELYLENLDNHRPLLPEIRNTSPDKLQHLNLHNGTIWRWNRPIVGHTKDGIPHIRVEHRVPSAGPTTVDMVANSALYIGLTLYFSKNITKYEQEIPFETLERNFYEACRRSFRANIKWINNKECNIQQLLIDYLLQKAKSELITIGWDKNQVEFYLGDVMYHRLLNGQNGASWQKSFVSTHGKNFQEMIELYHHYQIEGSPIWKWKV